MKVLVVLSVLALAASAEPLFGSWGGRRSWGGKRWGKRSADAEADPALLYNGLGGLTTYAGTYGLNGWGYGLNYAAPAISTYASTTPIVNSYAATHAVAAPAIAATYATPAIASYTSAIATPAIAFYTSAIAT